MNDAPNIRAGMLLVSDPFGDDPCFGRSVVLLTEHNDNGSVGFILNKGLSHKLPDLIEDMPDRGYRISLGGPVGLSTLHFLHIIGDTIIPDAHYVKDGIYWGGNFDVLSKLIKAGFIAPEEIAFFLGYSGWSKGQLADEIESGAWAAVSSAPYDILHCDDSMWYEIIHNEPSLADWRFIPEHPEDN